MTLGADFTKDSGVEQHKAALARAVVFEVSNGAQVVSQSDYQAVLTVARKRPVNHLLHLILCFFTVIIWVFGWVRAVKNANQNPVMIQIQLWIDNSGVIQRSQRQIS